MNTRLALLVLALGVGCSDYDLHSRTGPNDGVGDDDGDPLNKPGDDTVDYDGGITGRICSPSASIYVSGAEVTVEHEGEVYTAVTDGDGWFTLEGLPPGTHRVEVTKGSFSTTFDVLVHDGEITELAHQECLDANVDIAVVTGDYDNVQVVLSRLGLDYDLINGQTGSSSHIQFMRDPSRLSNYDIVFFNCGMDDNWTLYESQISQNLREFVQDGGSIYASDWASYAVEASFPDMASYLGNDSNYNDARFGMEGYVQAEVLDDSLEALLGTRYAQIYYDLPGWVVPIKPGTAEVLLRGEATYYTDPYGTSWETRRIPLALRGEYNGSVLYTSFHNERQTTGHMDLILEDFILSL